MSAKKLLLVSERSEEARNIHVLLVVVSLHNAVWAELCFDLACQYSVGFLKGNLGDRNFALGLEVVMRVEGIHCSGVDSNGEAVIEYLLYLADACTCT